MKAKKLLAGILSAAMLLGTVSFSAFADGETTEPVTYTDSESKTVTYQKVTDTDGNITISNETIGSDYAVAEYEIDGKSVRFKGTTLRSVNNLMRAYWEVNKTSSGCDYNSAMLPANGTGDLEWKIYGTVTQGEYLNSGALILPSLSGGYIWGSDGGYDWKSITVAAGTNNATIVSSETFNVEHTFVANGKETTAFTGIRFNGGFYAVPHSNMTFDACTFTGRLRTPNGDGKVTVNGCTFTGEANEPEYAFFYQASGKLNFTNNTIVESKYERGLNLDNKDLEATVSGNIIGKVTDQNRSAVQISGIKKIDIERNNITIDGGNVFTLHNNLYTAVAKPEVTIKDNTISGNGYLFYDDAKASGNTFDENKLLLVFAGNIIESGIDKKAGKDKTGALVPIESTGYLATRTESVAKIGDKEYTTLKDAVAAAQDGDTVTLANDVTESIKIDEGKTITLDLNGKTLTNTDGKHTIENYGTLVVEDGSQDKTGKVDNITNGRISFVNYEGGVATLNGGSFDRSMENGKVGATDDCNSCYTIKNWGIMTINENVSVNNKTDRQGGSSAIGNGYQNGANFDNHTNVTSANVKLTINGGKFTGGLNTIKNDDWAILEVNGGVFENNTQQCIMNWNEVSITGGIFTGEPNAIYNGYDNNSMDKGILEITGGEFNGNIQVYNNGTTSISGGTFNTDVSNYCASGFSPKLVNGKYVVDDSADTLNLTFKKHTDERVYDIVLNGAGKNINRLNAAEFKFDLSTTKMTYDIKAADGMALIPQEDGKYEFHFDGKDAIGGADSGAEIVIGTVTFDGYDTFTFKATVGRATATTTSDNLVTEFVTTAAAGKGTLEIGEDDNMIKDAEIKVPTQVLTINVLTNHNVGNNVAAYQDMTVAISGGNLAGNVLTYKLGNDNSDVTVATNVNGDVTSYQIKTELDQNKLYTVNVSGAGYRTARYTVTMNADKTLSVWNNVMSNEVTVVDDTKATTNFLAGDIVKDNSINIYDLSAVVAYFGTEMATNEYNKYAKYDLNRDGKIDIMDISMVLTSWGK
ncbi:MAG: dockerin type I domain-containing protein [Eubacteriales bacterium]|nr:dockerin type I domain-containing protein [Eubacteriales bacterium]